MKVFIQLLSITFISVPVLGSNCIECDDKDETVTKCNNNEEKQISEIVPTSEDIRIDNHKNLKLLPCYCGERSGNKIIGGDVARMFEYPWMAIIVRKSNNGDVLHCGGSIINKRYVLTAAHCVHGYNISYVRLGEYNTREAKDCFRGTCVTYIQNLNVTESVIHENYSKSDSGLSSKDNDIALLRLSDEVNYRERNINFVCLPTTTALRHRVLDNQNGTLPGWGITENRSFSDVLRVVQVPIYDNETCANKYSFDINRGNNANITANKLCAGAKNKNFCDGDSGGPLVQKAKYSWGISDRYVQFGIAIYNEKYCKRDIPGLYTDVRTYIGWILDHIAE